MKSGNSRELPNLFILGAPRCGTTWLYRALAEHPDVFVPQVKEPCYFAFANRAEQFNGPGDDQRVRDLDSYAMLFEGARQRIVVDASPLYLHAKKAPELIREAIPSARLVAILRQPADRAFSHYSHHRMLGREPCARFDEALEQEDGGLRASWSPFWFYRDVGRYGAQLCRLFDTFPRDQIRVYLFEDIAERPGVMLEDLRSFLDLEAPIRPARKDRVNRSGSPRWPWLHDLITRPNAVKTSLRWAVPERTRRRVTQRIRDLNLATEQMSPDTRRRLTDDYHHEIAEAARLIDRDLDHWMAV